MHYARYHQETGLALIEVMVAFTVVAVGVLGALKINTTLLSSTGQSKARSEAVALAQDRLERARNYNLQAACGDAVLDTPTTPPVETVTGTNEVFTIDSTFTNADTVGWKDVSICVRWRAGSCDPAISGDRVLLSSRIACTGSGTSAQIGQGGTQGRNGGFLKSPAGRATTSINIDYVEKTGDILVGAIDAQFKTKTIRRSNGDLLLVSTGTGVNANKILLITKKLACESQVPDYSTIRGKILLENSKGNPLIPPANLFPLISEGAVCRIDTEGILTNKYPSSGNTEYFWADYKCFVGAEWWGNIGVVSTESGNGDAVAKRACTGNVVSATLPGNIYSKHPQLSSSRAYRGYRVSAADPTIIETVGIGETSVLNEACTAVEGRNVYNNTSQHFVNHNFAVWTISGTINDSQCNTIASATRVNDGENSESPTKISDELVAHRNPGKYYCMSNDDGVSCEYATGVSSVIPVTTIRGTIYRGSGNDKASISNIELAGADCSSTNFAAQNNLNTYTYSCTLNWLGGVSTFPNGWNGAVNFITSDKLCVSSGANTNKVITPAGYTANIVINDSTKSLDLTNVDKAVTDIQFDFTARGAGKTCPVDLSN